MLDPLAGLSILRIVNSAGNRDGGIAISVVDVNERGRLDAPKDKGVIVLKIQRDFSKLLICFRSPFRSGGVAGEDLPLAAFTFYRCRTPTGAGGLEVLQLPI
ncbi:hypothetical protein RHGRI_006888 [Rhododendron griersonianum]|uniref:Uncharacterized protein n=1 Tax=Rhododendron griersonianum TaxID=479676 RepID=A0AAV6KV93_9ERIC|nr:hypothetical protein RHGRI_006888 [Rhododendron griersonianum]